MCDEWEFGAEEKKVNDFAVVFNSIRKIFGQPLRIYTTQLKTNKILLAFIK